MLLSRVFADSVAYVCVYQIGLMFYIGMKLQLMYIITV